MRKLVRRVRRDGEALRVVVRVVRGMEAPGVVGIRVKILWSRKSFIMLISTMEK